MNDLIEDKFNKVKEKDKNFKWYSEGFNEAKEHFLKAFKILADLEAFGWRNPSADRMCEISLDIMRLEENDIEEYILNLPDYNFNEWITMEIALPVIIKSKRGLN